MGDQEVDSLSAIKDPKDRINEYHQRVNERRKKIHEKQVAKKKAEDLLEASVLSPKKK